MDTRHRHCNRQEQLTDSPLRNSRVHGPFPRKQTSWHRNSMFAYLDEHTPHLRRLHAQLALPAAALDHDLHRIEAAVKAVITGIVREREAQVDQLNDDIAAATRDLATLARAVGDRRERDREADDSETLPRQLERLNEQAGELKQVCVVSWR